MVKMIIKTIADQYTKYYNETNNSMKLWDMCEILIGYTTFFTFHKMVTADFDMSGDFTLFTGLYNFPSYLHKKQKFDLSKGINGVSFITHRKTRKIWFSVYPANEQDGPITKLSYRVVDKTISSLNDFFQNLNIKFPNGKFKNINKITREYNDGEIYINVIFD